VLVPLSISEQHTRKWQNAFYTAAAESYRGPPEINTTNLDEQERRQMQLP